MLAFARCRPPLLLMGLKCISTLASLILLTRVEAARHDTTHSSLQNTNIHMNSLVTAQLLVPWQQATANDQPVY
ncbi:uncharacterized protein C8Q71DRAFT_221269 [Rhodofomes roseus]|uniref:Secreted protein n=1 Tax=Rhodofomes roseus TaxID=34475 RepID=A0ABQ8KUU2_9APHY|nr:uncharacterized protein C8Q71DRAFT_221269 [Rhodofomes roseus]KAH9842793.1 hypothetical protein C8Q71DRAFT_221269 [Rhodofomes roseus]